jgi:2-methylcitrate dehydratase PrpD
MTTGIDELVENQDAAVPIAQYVAELTYDDIDEANRAATKRLVLDCLGAGIAAANEPGVVELRQLVSDCGGRPDATLIKTGLRVPVHHAAAANSTACRALEIDDVHEMAVIHTSASIVPVAFAMAERSEEPVSGREFIAAVVAATDVSNRLSLASRVEGPGGFQPRTWSSTNLVGSLAAALTVAKIARADVVTTLHALGFGYSNAAASKQGLVDRALSVRVQHGLSVGNGVFAAQLALLGVTGPVHSLEGAFGYYRSFWGGTFDREVLLDGLGNSFSVAEVSIKPYPCCKFTHTAVAAAITAGQDPRFDPAKVRRIVITVDSAEYFNTVCMPLELKKRPQTTVEGQFSMPYCAAVGMVRGGVGFGDFQLPSATESEASRLAKLTECVLSSSPLDSELQFPRPARVEVELMDGTVISSEARYAPGHPDSHYGWDNVVEKFESCCVYPTPPLPIDAGKGLVEALGQLEELEDVRGIMQFLAW